MTTLTDFRAVYLPYCLQRLPDGRYIVLNREYKPLGLITHEIIQYETHPTAQHFKITKSLAKKLSWEGKDDLDSIYLYNDGTNPILGKPEQMAYFERLGLLLKLRITAP